MSFASIYLCFDSILHKERAQGAPELPPSLQLHFSSPGNAGEKSEQVQWDFYS